MKGNAIVAQCYVVLRAIAKHLAVSAASWLVMGYRIHCVQLYTAVLSFVNELHCVLWYYDLEWLYLGIGGCA